MEQEKYNEVREFKREPFIFLLLAVLVSFTTSIGLWWLVIIIVMLQTQVTIEAYKGFQSTFFYIRCIGTLTSLSLFLWFLWESVNFLFFYWLSYKNIYNYKTFQSKKE